MTGMTEAGTRADVFRGWYEDAVASANAEGSAVIDRMLEEAEARRRFRVDSCCCVVVFYAPVEVRRDGSLGPT
jgi:hypothetical protein